MPANAKLLEWLRATCKEFEHDVIALFRRSGSHSWPLTAADPKDLEAKLEAGGHFVSLPKEPAALANILEVSIVDFLLDRLKRVVGGEASRGTERGYPDIEFHGAYFGGGYHAIDVKIAMRKKQRDRPGVPPKLSTRTQSRITLYTGNTYFMYPSLHWPGTFRPFEQYESHVDVLGIYTMNEKTKSRVETLELIVQEPWKIASKKRSSTTREYLGAVMEIDRLREGRGDFETENSFYDFWRKFQFKIGGAVKVQLAKALAEKGSAPKKSKRSKPKK